MSAFCEAIGWRFIRKAGKTTAASTMPHHFQRRLKARRPDLVQFCKTRTGIMISSLPGAPSQHCIIDDFCPIFNKYIWL
jgi:hypothetical protein